MIKTNNKNAGKLTMTGEVERGRERNKSKPLSWKKLPGDEGGEFFGSNGWEGALVIGDIFGIDSAGLVALRPCKKFI